jgi:mono/diheme cytochrome c family protein
MAPVVRWLGYAIAALAGLAIAAVGAIWLLSSRTLNSRREVPVEHITVSSDSASVARGRHLISILGCRGCHGKQLEGKVFFDEPNVARLIAPNLTKAIQRYSDDSLALVIRDGVNAEGRGVLAMPSSAFYNLSNRDIGAIIATLRLFPATEPAAPLPANSHRLLGRLGLLLGEFKAEPDLIDPTQPRVGERGDTTQIGRGEYLARTSCIECHGKDLRGDAGTPSLAEAYGYSFDEFVRLARTSTPRVPKTLSLMASVALSRLSNMQDDELADLHAYLRSIPSRPAAAPPR